MTSPPSDVFVAATHADPYPYYAELARRDGLVRDANRTIWIAASADAVAAVLASELVSVRPLAEPVPAALAGSPAGALFGQLMRTTDGAGHDAAKHAAAGLADLGATAGALANRLAPRLLPPRPSLSLHDVWPLAFALPAYTVAALIGVPDDELAATRGLVADLVGAFAAQAAPDAVARGSAAAERLTAIVSNRLPAGPLAGPLAGFVERAERGGWRRTAAVANAVGLLTQSYEATAALIGQTLVALARHAEPRGAAMADVVREVARHDSPVQNTRRFVVRDGAIAGQAVAVGDAIVAILAAANRDPRANPDPDRFDPGRRDAKLLSFGLGGHACPGAAIAIAIAAAAADHVVARGVDLAPLARGVRYEPLPNVRLPVGAV